MGHYCLLIRVYMSIDYTKPLPRNVSNKTAGYTILLVLDDRKFPTRTQKLVEDLRGTCAANEVYRTIGELQEAYLISQVTNKRKFKDYVVTELGREYIKPRYPSLQNITNELAEFSIRKNQIESEEEIQEVFAAANEAVQRVVNLKT